VSFSSTDVAISTSQTENNSNPQADGFSDIYSTATYTAPLEAFGANFSDLDEQSGFPYALAAANPRPTANPYDFYVFKRAAGAPSPGLGIRNAVLAQAAGMPVNLTALVEDERLVGPVGHSWIWTKVGYTSVQLLEQLSAEYAKVACESLKREAKSDDNGGHSVFPFGVVGGGVAGGLLLLTIAARDFAFAPHFSRFRSACFFIRYGVVAFFFVTLAS
jgi:hypothetical protein